MKNIILIAIFTFFTFNIFAKSVDVEVNGMVCEFCASTIQKNLNKNQAVHSVAIDFDSKNVTIDFKKGQNLTDQEITDIIVNNGFNVNKINRK